MPKQSLTVGDIKSIEQYLEQQQNATNDESEKAQIDELIRKLDEMEVK